MRKLVLALVLAWWAIGCGDDDGSTAAPLLPQWSTFEADLARPVDAPNPFDPAQIEVSAEFASPLGEVRRVHAFVARDYDRSLVDGRERLAAVGDSAWRVRFTPDAIGAWRWRWRVQTPVGEEIGAWSHFDVGEPEPDAHGFLRRSPRDARHLEFDDGSSYIAIGENLAWYGAAGTFDYDRWLGRLQQQGATFIRLWMPAWAMGLEAIRRAPDGSVASSTLGNYDQRLDRAWQLDYVIEQAHRRGIAVMLAIQNHGPFSLTNNSEWDDNPYNIANGGPLRQPGEFFTDATARELFRRRLRYVVARWGHAPNLLAWELWNEVDLAQRPSDAAVIDWHREMAAEIRRLDPYDHLISTSTSIAEALNPNAGLAGLWQLEDIDFTQAHYYSFAGAPADFTQIFGRIAARLRRFDKPFLIAEAGVDFAGPAETLAQDPDGDGLHDLIWAGLFSGGFGSGMSWWWDNVVDPQDWYFHLGPLSRMTEGVDFPGEAFVVETGSGSAPDGRLVRQFVLRGRSTVLVWIKNGVHHWYAPDARDVAGARVRLTGLPAARYAARWLDTRTGAFTDAGTWVPAAGLVELEVPTFARDVALRLDVSPDTGR